MILFPAIDLKGGACVRLVRGEMASATVFNDDPAAQARHFAAIGFRWLHVVDLDGAFAGHSVNGEAVRAIRRAVDLKIQLGGGIRDRAAIDAWLALGIDRVVLGTIALRDPGLVREAAAGGTRRKLLLSQQTSGCGKPLLAFLHLFSLRRPLLWISDAIVLSPRKGYHGKNWHL